MVLMLILIVIQRCLEGDGQANAHETCTACTERLPVNRDSPSIFCGVSYSSFCGNAGLQ